jgi:hypothetical protein
MSVSWYRPIKAKNAKYSTVETTAMIPVTIRSLNFNCSLATLITWSSRINPSSCESLLTCAAESDPALADPLTIRNCSVRSRTSAANATSALTC